MDAHAETKRAEQPQGLSNAEIADQLATVAQLRAIRSDSTVREVACFTRPKARQ